MAACEFPITFHQDTEELIDRFRHAVGDSRGTFEGDSHAGRFSITTETEPVEGTYTIEDHVFHFEITTHPSGVTCHKIENTFRSLIGSPPDTSLNFN